jgi:Zn-dependent peptidase ImmA (M78 family)/DNA-binding XRE family transcriptional regulator
MAQKQENSIGDKLYKLRKKKGLSSKDAATALGFASHKSIIDIEFGRKKITETELQKLAQLYGVQVQDLFIKQSSIPSFKALFRAELAVPVEKLENKLAELYPDIELYFDLIEEVYPNTLLEQSYKHWMKKDYTEPSNKTEAISQGDLLADQLRKGLDLGEGPINNMLLVCELLNVVTLFMDFSASDISGLYCEYNGVPIILINSTNYPVRKRFSIAHELCHFLVDNPYLSQSPEITEEFNPFEEKNNRNYREVRANAFAASFLMPEDGLKFFLKHFLGKTSKSISIHDVVHISHNYGVSFETACYRLKNLDLISDPAYEEMKSLKSGVQMIKKRLYDCSDTNIAEVFSDNNFTSRLKNVAIDAYQQGKLSIGKFCDIFNYPVLDQKKLLEELQIKAPKIVSLNRPNPLL